MTVSPTPSTPSARRDRQVCVGVVVPPGPLPTWMHRAIERLAAEPAVQLTLAVRPDRLPARPHGGPPARWAWYARLAGRRSRALRAAPGPDPVGDHPVASSLSAPEVAALDVLVDLPGALHPATGAAPGPRPDVWRFGFGPDRQPDADLAAATDVATGRPTASVALLAGPAGTPRVLREGTVRTVAHSWRAHRDTLLLRAADWPALAGRDLAVSGAARGPAAGAAHPADRPADTDPPVPSEPGTPVPVVRHVDRVGLGRLVWGQARARVARVARFLRDDQWHVGVVPLPITSFLRPDALPAPRWLPEGPADVFYADPFPFDHGRSIVFERYSLHRRVGTLHTVRLGDAPGPPQPLLTPGHHVSYPFVVEHDGRTWCTPETAAAREVVLHELTGDPWRLEPRATLVADTAAVDPTVVSHRGRWWLFFTDGDRDADADLHVWHADDLLGPWAPHARNPVKVDVRSARPAGTPFVVAGALHRPAMDNSGAYGGRVVINRVTRLTPDEFAEHPVAVVPPFPGRFPDGIHTLAAAGPVTIVDGRRRRTVPTALPAKLVRRLRPRAGPPV